jgi:hypothetical protein
MNISYAVFARNHKASDTAKHLALTRMADTAKRLALTRMADTQSVWRLQEWLTLQNI